MRNQSVRINLSIDGKENTKVEVNGSLRGQGLNMKMGKKMWYYKIDLMKLDRNMGHNSSRSIEVRTLVSWSVGHVVRSIVGDFSIASGWKA